MKPRPHPLSAAADVVLEGTLTLLSVAVVTAVLAGFMIWLWTPAPPPRGGWR